MRDHNNQRGTAHAVQYLWVERLIQRWVDALTA
jgi:hypothetical protein